MGQGDSYAVRFESAIVQGLKVNLMYLGTDLSNEIRRGKKPGRRQGHDCLVLAMTGEALDSDGYTELPRVSIKGATAAAWVLERGTPLRYWQSAAG